jgi:hypothetical protein
VPGRRSSRYTDGAGAPKGAASAASAWSWRVWRAHAAGLTDRRSTTLVCLDGMATIAGTAVIGATLPSVHERSKDGSRLPSGHWLAQSHDLRERGKPAAVRSATAWLSAMFSWRAGEPIEPLATELLTKDGDRQEIVSGKFSKSR